MPTYYTIEYLEHGTPVLVIRKRHAFVIPRSIHELWSGRQKDKTLRTGLECVSEDVATGCYILTFGNLTITLNGETIDYAIKSDNRDTTVMTDYHVVIPADYYDDDNRYHFTNEYMGNLFPGRHTQRYVARGLKNGYYIALADMERNTLGVVSTSN